MTTRYGERFIDGDPQDLLRRGQVRAVLALERQQANPAYLADLRAVLDPNRARSHLRVAVLTWLRGQLAAHDEELVAAERNLDLSLIL